MLIDAEKIIFLTTHVSHFHSVKPHKLTVPTYLGVLAANGAAVPHIVLHDVINHGKFAY